jgi:D-tyrosyl-tRNA(Tyr) deacylase
MLANYALSFETEERWRAAVDEAVEATRAAHPGREVVVYVDKKALKGAQRQALGAYLDERGVRWTFKEQEV